MATANDSKSGRNGSSSRTPIWSKKFWPVEVSVFEFMRDDRPTHSVKVSKSFRRDEESKWESTEYLAGNDLLAGAELLKDAYQFTQARLQKFHASRRENSDGIDNRTSEGTPF